MKKALSIEGMMCQNCVKHVTRALESVPGVTAVQVSLEDKTAVVECSDSVSEEALTSAVSDAGYEVVEIRNNEG